MKKRLYLLFFVSFFAPSASLVAQGVQEATMGGVKAISRCAQSAPSQQQAELGLFASGMASTESSQDPSKERPAGQNQPTRKGLVLGGGLALHTYTTNWYYFTRETSIMGSEYDEDHFPRHLFSRIAFVLSLEYQSMLDLGPLDVDLRLDLNYGFSGGTNEDWVMNGDQVSSGGMAAGLTIGPRICLPLEGSENIRWTPFVSPAIHYQALRSDGKDIGKQYAYMGNYYTGVAWTEHVIGATVGIGVMMDIGRLVITPEIRSLVAAGGATDWSPKTYYHYYWEGDKRQRGISNEGNGGTLFLLTLGWRL